MAPPLAVVERDTAMTIAEIDGALATVNGEIFVYGDGSWEDDWRAPFTLESDGMQIGVSLMGTPLWDDDNNDPAISDGDELADFLRESFMKMGKAFFEAGFFYGSKTRG